MELCTRAVLIDGGKVVADGPTADLLADEALMLAHGLERPHILQHHHPHGRPGAPSADPPGDASP